MRKRAGAKALDGSLRLLSRIGKLHPAANPGRHGVRVIRDLPYLPSGERAHLLDIYQPPGDAIRPALLYVHGGGFRILSKDTHWMMGLAFARHGYTVFNINYRLAPKFPFPTGLEDACAAVQWVMTHAAEYGADARRMVLAGESAGANLVTSITLASCIRRPEPFAQAIYELDPSIRAVLPACGVFQVSNPERFAQKKQLPVWLTDRLYDVCHGYLPDSSGEPDRYALADPVCLLERLERSDRPLPPFFAPVGTKDPLIDDTRRLKQALARLGGTCEAPIYVGGVHAFHALLWRKQARLCWRDQYRFLDSHLGPQT